MASPSAPEAPPDPGLPEHLDDRRRFRSSVVRGAGAGLLTGVAVYGALAVGNLPSWFALLMGAMLLVVLPTATTLTRRVALNGALVIGWAQVLWWIRWPFALNHGSLLVALGLGWTVGRVVMAVRPSNELRRLMPYVRAVDVMLGLAIVVASYVVQAFAFAGSAQSALVALLPGADNYAHFHMFATLRYHGATFSTLATAPDGSGWAFSDYPQGFHALVATLSELTDPRATQGPPLVLAYAHGIAAVVVLGVLTLTAATLSLPRLCLRPSIAAPVVLLAWTAFLWEPGQKVLADGFGNFWVAALAASCALVLSCSPWKPWALGDALAVSGLLVTVAHAWAPLLVIAAPAGLAVLMQDRSRADVTAFRRRRFLCVAALGAGAAGAAKALVILSTHTDVTFLVTAFGGLHGTAPLPAFTLILAGLYVCLSYRSWLRRRIGDVREVSPADSMVGRRVFVLSLAVTFGLALATLLFVAQLRTLGTTSYYFLKFLMGFELILAGFVPAVVGMLLATTTRPRSDRRTTVAASVAAVVCATQFFGHLAVRDALLLSEAQDGGTASVGPPFSRDDMAQSILAAARSTTPEESYSQDYLALRRGGAAEAFYPDGWFHGMNASLSQDVWTRLNLMRKHVYTLGAATKVATTVLNEDEGVEMVVDPAYVDELRDRLETPELAGRVVSWPESASRSQGDHLR